ncbi:MAG TPA: hypothetical protein VGL22_01740 [Terracidiphilus sp.]
MEVLAGFTKSTGVWENEAQFRSLVALLHESVHYQQDICTGVGHWDHLARARYRKDALTAFREFSFFGESGMKSEQQARQRLVSDSIFNSYPLRDLQARATLDAALGNLPAYEKEFNQVFTIPRLFELEAVIATWSSLAQLKTSETGAQIADAFSYLYSPSQMPPDYLETYQYFNHAFLLIFGLTEESSRDEIGRVLDAFYLNMPLLLDIAFAYPPPTYFEQHPDTRADFEPGVRLVRICRELQIAPLTSKAEEVSVLDWLDESTRHTPQYDYPAVAETYQAWADYFAPMVDADPIAAWRREVCNDRIADPTGYAFKRLQNFILHDLPLFIDLPGQKDVMYLTDRLLREGGSDLFWEMVALEKDFGLIDLFLSGGATPFSCPLAEAGCEVRRETPSTPSAPSPVRLFVAQARRRCGLP